MDGAAEMTPRHDGRDQVVAAVREEESASSAVNGLVVLEAPRIGHAATLHERGNSAGHKHGKDWLSSMERFAFPRLGKLPVSEVSSADVVETLRKVWHEGPATARRVRQRISTVMEYAVALNYRDDNPCSRIGPILGPQQDLVRHMPALPHRDVATVVETVRASRAAPVVKLAFEFLVLTAARSGARCRVDGGRHRGARLDRPGHADQGEARAPGAADPPRRTGPRRGAGAQQRERARVPEPTRQAVQRHGAVGTAQDAGGPRRASRLPFHVPGLGRRGDEPPARGRRAALAHVVQNKVEAAYARSDLFERRRRLMDHPPGPRQTHRVAAVERLSAKAPQRPAWAAGCRAV